MTIILQLISACAASLTAWVVTRRFRRSPLDNIPGPPSPSFWKGNVDQFMNRNGWDFHRHIAQAYGSVVKINGFFGDKQLYVFDSKALHHIVKDQYIYEATELFTSTVYHLFGPGLSATSGDQHRKQRKMLNPLFSTIHMRYMVPTFYGIAGKLRDAIALQVANGPVEIDMLQWMTRAALELIAQSGLGYSFDPLTEDSMHPYVKAIKAVIPCLAKLNTPRQLLPFIAKYTPTRFRVFMMNLLPWKDLHELRDVTDIVQAMGCEVLESKRLAVEKGEAAGRIGQGKDLMSVLIKANMEASEEDRLSEEELLGQVSVFVFAAMDTTSSGLSRILHILSEHPKEQEILRKEIVTARQNGGDLSHDELIALPYLDAVCKETLRLYPPLPFSNRITCKDVILPLSKPIRGVDGKEINEIAVPNNTNIIVAIMASNCDPEIWGEDAAEWKPERWLSPLPNSVTAAHIPGVYSNLMTFMGGGRSCIGFKFALLEIKVVLSLLLESFHFSPDKQIEWNMANQLWPSVEGSYTAQLPLRVSKVCNHMII